MRIHWLQKKGPVERDLPLVMELLERIKTLLRISEQKNLVSLNIKSEIDWAILEELEKTEKILKKMKKKKLDQMVLGSLVSIKVNKKRFDTFYKKMKLRKPLETKLSKLYLTPEGDLYREPKDKYCYPMDKKSNRHRIIRFLVTNKGYRLTEFISTELGIESEKTIRTEIGKIRNNIEKYLKIKGKDFFQGKKESGYRINPKYKVILKNE